MTGIDKLKSSAQKGSPARLQESLNEVIGSLSEILTNSERGEIEFGAGNQPLRTSQIYALINIRRHLQNGKSLGYVVQPGGTGKTREGIALAHALHRHGKKSLFVVPSQVALEDFAQKAEALCPDLPVGRVYQGAKQLGNLTFITQDSLQLRTGTDTEIRLRTGAKGETLRINPLDYDMVIWDEAHEYLTDASRRLLEKFSHAINIGMTATPYYYKGKEVGDVFGEKIYEVDIKTATSRGEIVDHTNLMINTQVVTEIEQNRFKEGEESPEVGIKINTPPRNRIFPKIYFDMVAELPSQREHRLFGDPMLVFCAGIKHTHDLADMFNDMLMPLIKGERQDEGVRALLRSKGIDPDKVEAVAAPFHSGGRDEIKPMSREDRHRLIQDYHDRKVLALVSTKALQASFDSPMTSIVMDTVPRQTYVGVGQAAMRALRTYAGDEQHPPKEMAFIFNCQEADYKALSFDDFQSLTTEERGQQAILKPIDTAVSKEKDQTSDYQIVSGEELKDLSRERKKLGTHHAPVQYVVTTLFSGQQREYLNKLVQSIAKSKGSMDTAEINELIGFVAPWAENMAQVVAQRENIDLTKLEPDLVSDAIADAHLKTIAYMRTRTGGILWSRYHGEYRDYLKQGLVRLNKEYENVIEDTYPDDYWQSRANPPQYGPSFEDVVAAIEDAVMQLPNVDIDAPKYSRTKRAARPDVSVSLPTEVPTLKVGPEFKASLIAMVEGMKELGAAGMKPNMKRIVISRLQGKSPEETAAELKFTPREYRRIEGKALYRVWKEVEARGIDIPFTEELSWMSSRD